MDNPIILHCNYVEQGQSIREMCDKAVAWGYDGIEFRRQRFSIDEEPEAYLDAVAAAVTASTLEHVMFGAPGPDVMTPDAERREQEIQTCLDFYRMAADRFKLTVCNTMAGSLTQEDVHFYHFDQHGSKIATEEQWTWAVDAFQRLGDLAGELGFKLAFETHNCYLHDLAQPTLDLVQRIDRPGVGVNFDYGNIRLHPDGETLEASLELLLPHLFEVHLKNMYLVPGQQYFNFLPCPLANGVINNRAMLRILNRSGYNGPLVIEAPREGDREHFAVQDLAYLQTLMAEA